MPSNYKAILDNEKAALEKAELCEGQCADEDIKTPAQWHCTSCTLRLCDQCCLKHSRNKATKAHETISIADPLKKGPPTEAPKTVPRDPSRCSKHGHERLAYCRKCETAVCW